MQLSYRTNHLGRRLIKAACRLPPQLSPFIGNRIWSIADVQMPRMVTTQDVEGASVGLWTGRHRRSIGGRGRSIYVVENRSVGSLWLDLASRAESDQSRRSRMVLDLCRHLFGDSRCDALRCWPSYRPIALRRNSGRVASAPVADIGINLQSSQMRFLTLPPLLLALSACGASGPMPRMPNAKLANEIEAKLRAVPCVGSMNRWERHYEFVSKPSRLARLLTLGKSDRWFDYGIVEVSYYQAGYEEFRAGQVRSNGVSGMRFNTDDRDYNVVFGHYDIGTRTASLWACGPTLGSPLTRKIVVR